MRLIRPERKYEASWMAALQEFEEKGIGFAIRPSAWSKGYGRKILELALLEAKKIGITNALVTCNDSNLGSRKIIERNGGNFQDINEFKGEMVRRYWIEIP